MKKEEDKEEDRLRLLRNILIVLALAQFIALIVLIFIYFITWSPGWS